MNSITKIVPCANKTEMEQQAAAICSKVGMVVSVILFGITKWTMNDYAAAATILAALSTVALNVYRALKEKKGRV